VTWVGSDLIFSPLLLEELGIGCDEPEGDFCNCIFLVEFLFCVSDLFTLLFIIRVDCLC
jgi:hypothetical protein